jgi:hypothetical protein
MASSTQQISKFTLDDINRIKTQGFSYELPESTQKLIIELSKLVGSPEYIRTPIFTKKKKSPNYPPRKITNDDWEVLKNFKPTPKMELTDLNTMKGYLNKITDSNYEIQKQNIMKLLGSDIQSEDYEKITNLIFEVASSNKFYSKVYANLFSELISFDTNFNEKLQNEFMSYFSKFDSIKSVHPNDDYELFCKNNIENEKRKALSMFIVNLMHKNIIEQAKVIELINNLVIKFNENVNVENKTDFINEIFENLFILLSESYNDLSQDSNTEYNLIYTNIVKVSKLKSKDNVSLNSKTLFKIMDLIDLLDS